MVRNKLIFLTNPNIIFKMGTEVAEIQTLYKGAEKILVAVDCIIFGFQEGKLKLLLFKRKVEPFRNEWSLLGSFVKNDEDVASAAIRILEETTGLTGVYLEELGSYGNTNRDPGGRVISIAYYALIKLEQSKISSVIPFEAYWWNIEDVPDMILDHGEMIQNALKKLRQKAKNQPIGFELLNEKFTITELKALYDAIYDKKLDRGNFRKKILSMGILDILDEKDKLNSKKGAFFYRFNEKKYAEMLERGNSVDFL